MLFNSTEGPAIILALIYGFIMVYNSCRTRCKLTRQGIVPAGFSSWTYLYSNNGDDSSFLNVTGYNRATFEMLHAILYPPVDRIPRGRRPLLDTRGKLGLLLVFLTSKITSTDGQNSKICKQNHYYLICCSILPRAQRLF